MKRRTKHLSVRDGTLIPMGNNFAYVLGDHPNKVDDVDIGPNTKNGLSVNHGEIMQFGGNGIRVFSAEPILSGISPSKLVQAGINPNIVFAAQERYKDIHHLKDDGSHAKFGDWLRGLFGKKETIADDTPEYYGGDIEPAVMTAALPAKFNGSQAAAARYAEGYKFGKKIARKRDRVAPYLMPFIMGPLAPGAILGEGGGKAVDTIIQMLTNNKRNGWADAATFFLDKNPKAKNIGQIVASFLNPGYSLGFNKFFTPITNASIPMTDYEKSQEIIKVIANQLKSNPFEFGAKRYFGKNLKKIYNQRIRDISYRDAVLNEIYHGNGSNKIIHGDPVTTGVKNPGSSIGYLRKENNPEGVSMFPHFSKDLNYLIPGKHDLNKVRSSSGHIYTESSPVIYWGENKPFYEIPTKYLPNPNNKTILNPTKSDIGYFGSVKPRSYSAAEYPTEYPFRYIVAKEPKGIEKVWRSGDYEITTNKTPISDIETILEYDPLIKTFNRVKIKGYKLGGETKVKNDYLTIPLKGNPLYDITGETKYSDYVTRHGPDFSTIKTTNNRPYNQYNVETAYDYFKGKELNDYQIAAFLANAIEESGIEPYALDKTGVYYGISQWDKSRYSAIRKSKKDKDYSSEAESKDLNNQLMYYYNSVINGNTTSDWNHGGKGSGYNTAADARQAFRNAASVDDAVKALVLGYVRPTGGIDSYKNRAKVAEQIYKLISKQ